MKRSRAFKKEPCHKLQSQSKPQPPSQVWSIVWASSMCDIIGEAIKPISYEGDVEDVPTGGALEEVGRNPFQVVQVQALSL